MSKFNILLVAGTRPNFIKLAPLFHTLIKQDWCEVKICHTGQHYDRNMFDVFWECLDLPSPDFSLGIKAASVPEAIGATTTAIGKLLQENSFNLVVVFGDVNATVGGAIAGIQLGIDVMHVEAGLRSFDRGMPEEVNRVIVDHISSLLMISEPSGLQNLVNEGVDKEKTFFVGNIMIESLINSRSKWEFVSVPEDLKYIFNKEYIVATFHRPENVDTNDHLMQVVKRLVELSDLMPVVFPVHPRTKSMLNKYGLYQILDDNKKIVLTSPLGYFEFLKLISKATVVVTDSGGVQEETTFLRKPCITVRKNTERPSTILQGTNLLTDLHHSDFINVVKQHIIDSSTRVLEPIPYWDNQVSQRILSVIMDRFNVSLSS